MNLSKVVPMAAVVTALITLSGGAWSEDSATGKLLPRTRPAVSVDNWSFQSALMGRTYDISIGLPLSYVAEPEKNWPAIIVVDGNRMFGMALDLTRGLSGSQEVEDLFVIGIGTPFEDGQDSWVRRRVHEFSPANEWPMTDPFGAVVKQLCEGQYQLTPAECVGGAPAFLAFIRDELLAVLHRQYRLDADKLGLFGVSAGGFFASWAVLQQGSPFHNYIISSPAMAYGDGEIFRLEASYAENHKDLKANVYMAAGMLETNSPFLEGVGKIVSGMAGFSGLLATRNYPNFRLQTEMHPGLGHSDAAAATFAIGLRRLYGK